MGSMTTVEQLTGTGERAGRGAAATVAVFGVDWPAYKLHALVAGVLVAALVFAFGGTGILAGWLAAGVAAVVWWGGRVVLRPRWDDSGRDHHARS